MELLDQNALYNILEKVDPKDVKSLCLTSKKFAKLCDNPAVFRRLMRFHYPDIPINQDSKKQFNSIVDGENTYYHAVFNNDYDRIIGFRKGYEKRIPTLEIPGMGIDVGSNIETEVWLSCRYDQFEMNINGTCGAFLSQETALQDAYENFILEADHHIENMVYNFEITEEEAVHQLGIYPYPYQKEEIEKALLSLVIDDSLPHYSVFVNDRLWTIYFQVQKINII